MSNVYNPPGQNNDKMAGSTQNLREQAADMARDLKNKASDVGDHVTRAAKDKASELGAAAKKLSGDATEKIEDAANERKSMGANYIGSIAQAVDRAAGEFDTAVPQAASYMRQASHQIQDFADSIDGRDVRELVGEVQDFARKQPTLFFGGAVILGFAALRFLKSAPASSQHGSQVAMNPDGGNFQARRMD